jgi:hypothetical protein
VQQLEKAKAELEELQAKTTISGNRFVIDPAAMERISELKGKIPANSPTPCSGFGDIIGKKISKKL